MVVGGLLGLDPLTDKVQKSVEDGMGVGVGPVDELEFAEGLAGLDREVAELLGWILQGNTGDE